MRILVVSDTHGNLYNLKKAVEQQKSAEIIIHCGDSKGELDDIKMLYNDKAFYAVKGNCDFASMLSNDELITVENKRIFITHGHIYDVKYTLYELRRKAREENADVVLFGHTHNPLCQYDDGVYFLNPGSLGGYEPTYAYIDITDKGILTNIVKLK